MTSFDLLVAASFLLVGVVLGWMMGYQAAKVENQTDSRKDSEAERDRSKSKADNP
jgi:hypothetical protein